MFYRQQVCRAMKEIVDQSSASQYIIRLAMFGYTDGHGIQDERFSTSASRLREVYDHINRWKHLDYLEDRIKIPGASRHEILAGGVFAYETQSTLNFLGFPSRIRQSPLRSWSFNNDLNARDFTIVPSEDLLILAEV